MKDNGIPLGDLATVVSGYAFKSKDFTDFGIPVLKIANIKHERVVFDPIQYLPHDFLGIDQKFHVKPGDVMISLTGSHISQPNSVVGRVARYRHEKIALLNQRAGRIVIKDASNLDQGFLYYFLRQESVMRELALNAGGAANQANISPKDVERILLPKIDIETQSTISKSLSPYDDLIENNRRRIALLEDAAQQLYKEWFVRFRFPGHEHVEVVDGVPEGWAVTTIEEMAETIGGGTPSTKKPEYWDDGNITWFSPTDLTNNDSLVLLDSAKKINERGLAGSSAKMLPPETILMSSRASVGFFGLFEGEACTNQGFISLIPKRESTRMYLLFNLIERRDEIIGLASGATYKEINKSTFRAMPIKLPERALLRQFEVLADENIKQVRLLMKSNHNLKRARDLLLPKLMSGEIAA